MQAQNSQSQAASQNSEDFSYRMVRKSYHCHICDKDFKKIAPVSDLVEVECPQCNETFCEELPSTPTNLSGTNSPIVREQTPQQNENLTRSNPPSPPVQPSQPPQRGENFAENILASLLGIGRSYSQRNSDSFQSAN